MSYIGSWKIDDLVTFVANTHDFATGAATDADAVPSYRVYEDETGTAILTGNMAKLDDANTTGFYSEQITLSAANGFEKGKSYHIYISATVDSVAGTTFRCLQIEAEVDANVVSGGVNTTSWGGTAVASANVLIDGAITAAKIATNAIDDDALSADAVTAIQSGLATAAGVSAVETDTQNIQTRLPAALSSNGNMKSDVLEVNNIVIDGAGTEGDPWGPA